MIGGNILTKLGSINGFIDGTTDGSEFLAVELGSNNDKVIHNVDASFQFDDGDSKTSQPFGVARIVVIKKSLDEIPISLIYPSQVITGVDILFDVSIFDYDGVRLPCYFKAGKTETLSVILFPVAVAGSLVARFASLSVQGDDGGSTNSKLRAVN